MNSFAPFGGVHARPTHDPPLYSSSCNPLHAVALPVLALVTVVATESLHEFVQGKRAQRVQSQPAVMRVSRAVYNQLDADTLQLLASTRDFDERGAGGTL